MKKLLISFLLSMLLLLGLVGCEETLKEDLYIPIKSVRATSPMPLDDRTDWKFYVNDIEYKRTVKGRVIHAQPQSTDKVAYFVIKVGDDKSSIAKTQMTLISPKYDALLKSQLVDRVANAEQPTEILDQSTRLKMMTADVLTVVRKGIATPHIEHVTLEHRHNLIEYHLIDFPKDAKVKLMSKQFEVKPFDWTRGTVSIFQYPQYISFEVEADGKTYTLNLEDYLRKLPVEKRFYKDMHYLFDLKFDGSQGVSDQDVLSVENLEAVKWSIEELS